MSPPFDHTIKPFGLEVKWNSGPSRKFYATNKTISSDYIISSKKVQVILQTHTPPGHFLRPLFSTTYFQVLAMPVSSPRLKGLSPSRARLPVCLPVVCYSIFKVQSDNRE